MANLFDRWSKVRPYRVAAPAMVAGGVLVPAGLFALGLPEFVSVLPGIALLIAVTVLTYKRHRDAGFTGTLVLLMVLQFNIGPSWGGLPPGEFYLSSLVFLIPVLWGCIFQSVDGADLQRATAVTRAR